MAIFSSDLNPFGLDLSDRVIKLAQLKKRDGKVYLHGFGRASIPEGLIEDGEIKNPEELARLIKEVMKKTKPFPIDSKFVTYSIPETKGFIRVIKIPYTEKEGIENAVFMEAEQFFPINLADAYVDWQIIENHDNKVLEVMVAAVPQNLVDSYSEVMNIAGLKPVAAEIESMAITRSLVNENFSKKTILIIDLGQDRTGFIIFKSPAVQFTASIPVCGKELNRAIASNLGVDEMKAEELKNKCGINTRDDCYKVYKAMEYSLNEMIGYINKLMGYYCEHYKDEPEISKVIVCGGEAKIPEFNSFLSLKIKKEIEKGNPWVNVVSNDAKEIPPISREDSLVFVTVLGLALRGLEENNCI